MERAVSEVICTIPAGVVLTTRKMAWPLLNRKPGTIMALPLSTGLFSRWCLMKLSIPEMVSWLHQSPRGARTTLEAGCTTAFLTITLSPMETPAFFLRRLSILMMCFPLSSPLSLHTMAAVLFPLSFPVISTMSPMSTPRIFLVSSSSRAYPLPTSSL